MHCAKHQPANHAICPVCLAGFEAENPPFGRQWGILHETVAHVKKEGCVKKQLASSARRFARVRNTMILVKVSQ